MKAEHIRPYDLPALSSEITSHYLNIGFGHLDRRRLPSATAAFAGFLRSAGKTPQHVSCHWKGHAYTLFGSPRRRLVADGLILVGDAAGLADPRSGEGIRPAVESGLLAAATITEVRHRYTRDRLILYENRGRERFGGSQALSSAMSPALPSRFGRRLAARLLRTPWFVRHVLLDRWFLHAHEPALAVHN